MTDLGQSVASKVTDEMVERALAAYQDCPPEWPGQTWAESHPHAMRAALEAALSIRKGTP